MLDARAGSEVVVPGGEMLLHADFGRDGNDLVLTGPDGETVVILNYFALGTPPALVTDGGASLAPDLVSTLAGEGSPLLLAQAGAAGGAGEAIGRVISAGGNIQAARAGGGTDQLDAGSLVYQGDVLETGPDGLLEVEFEDGSKLKLSANARMVVDEMVYEAGASEGTALFSLVQGTFGFESGDIAKTGPDAIQIRTPVATIGIRGTVLLINVNQAGEVLSVTVVGDSGSIALIDPATGDVIGTLTGTTDGSQPNTASFAAGEDGPTYQFIAPQDLPDTYGVQGVEQAAALLNTEAGPQNNGDGTPSDPVKVVYVDPQGNLTVTSLDDLGSFTTSGGSQFAFGDTGNDGLFGDSNNDQGLFGGTGGDTGGGGPQSYSFGSGDASFTGGAGFDILNLSAPGADPFSYTITQGPNGEVVITQLDGSTPVTQVTTDAIEEVSLALGGGSDAITVGSLANTDIADDTVILKGGAGNDVLDAHEADKRVVLEGQAGDDLLLPGTANDDAIGGSGADTVSYEHTQQGVAADLTAGTATGAEIGSDVIASVENLIGGSGGDELVGDGLANVLDGRGGADRLFGLGGDDRLIVGDDTFDTVDGGAGMDRLELGAAGIELDLVGRNAGSLANLEEIALGSGGRLIADPDAIADASGASNTMIVNGDPTSGVQLVGDWTIAANDAIHRLVSGGVTLDVDATVNVSPVDIALDNATVAENDPGAIVGALSVTDPDAGDTHGFTVSDNRFEVVENQLRLADGESLDHESEPTVTVDVTATDAQGLERTESFNVTVADVNEAPVQIGLVGSDVAENAPGATVGTLSATDPDDGDTHAFTVADYRFVVDGDQLKLAEGVSLDHESEPSVTVDVTATDEGGLSHTQSFTVTVSDVNEAPTNLALDNATVAENDPGATVGTLSVTDPDAGDTHGFTVSDDRFVVDGNELRLANEVSLDHESEPSVTVDVTAIDGQGLERTESFTIAVGDVNEAPTGISLEGDTVAENAAGATVGTLSVTDPDAGDTHGFTVSDNRFVVDGNELKLAEGVSLDHESEPSVTVDVTAIDAQGLERTESFTIAVGDVNEAPTGIVLKGSSVAENDPGAVVGALSVADPDAGDTQAYTISDNRFEVVGGQLKLIDGVSLDFESEPSVPLEIEVTDSGGLSHAESFTVTVTDVPGTTSTYLVGSGDDGFVGTGEFDVLNIQGSGTAPLVFDIGQNQDGEVLITQLDGEGAQIAQVTASAIEEISLTLAGGNDRVTVGPLGDTDIADDTVVLNGLAGADLFDASATDKRVVAHGGGDDDTLFGGSADDDLFGGAGNDVGFGGEGDDLLDDTDGGDALVGDGGDDIINTAGGGGAGDGPDLLVGDSVAGSASANDQYNLAFAIDVSGSMNGTVGDSGETRLELALSAIKGFVQELVDEGLPDSTALNFITFNGGVEQTQEFTLGQLDQINAFLNAEELETFGTTSFAEPLEEASAWLQEDANGNRPGDKPYDPSTARYADHTNRVYFISDGQDSSFASDLNDPSQLLSALYGINNVDRIPDLEVEAFGFGAQGVNVDQLDMLETGDPDADPNPGVADFAVVVDDDPELLTDALDAGSLSATPGSDTITGGDQGNFIVGDFLPTDLFQSIVGGIQGGEPGGGDIGDLMAVADTAVGANDVLTGGADMDFIFGQGGDDAIRGLGGDDLIHGGFGDDRIVGGPGEDSIAGGPGADVFVYESPGDGTAAGGEAADGGDTIADFTSGEDTIELDGDFGTLTGVGQLTDGTNFEVISGGYYGANGTSSEYAQGNATVIVDGAGSVIYDANGAGEGYTILANVGPGTEVAASDVTAPAQQVG